MVQTMERYITSYSTGSILGRTVYSPQKKRDSAYRASIFGTKVYKNHSSEKMGKCQRLLGKFQKH